jgi:predicted Zn-dependent protease
MGSTASTAIMQGYGLGTQLGILLPYSRTQESEADHVGLILMAKAGYDPAQALEFWKRMMTKDKKGVKMPEFMSTHPNDASRLKELEEFLPEARKYYAPAHAAQSSPPGPPAATRPSSASAAPVAGRWGPAPR